MSAAPSVAIVKPDHLGDQVLAAPAIRAVRRAGFDATLYCSPGAERLARFLHPGLRIAPVCYPHLRRPADKAGPAPPDHRTLERLDAVLLLRSDETLSRMAERLKTPVYVIDDHLDVHETALQQRATERLSGAYDRDALLTEQHGFSFPRQAQRVGLCMAAGFANNVWPAAYWTELAGILDANGIAVWLIGGPAEAALLRMVGTAAGIPVDRIVTGDPGFTFLETVRYLDAVIATDSGAGHLCSLAAPVLSIFGASSFRRFAPFGRHNRVISADVPCSPCSQFHRSLLNSCVSRECLLRIRPQHVAAALMCDVREPDTARVLDGDVKVFQGVSRWCS